MTDSDNPFRKKSFLLLFLFVYGFTRIGASIQQEKYNCPNFNPGTTCLCHASRDYPEQYKKICIVNSIVQTHIRHGDVLPGGTNPKGQKMDCDCKVITRFLNNPNATIKNLSNNGTIVNDTTQSDVNIKMYNTSTTNDTVIVETNTSNVLDTVLNITENTTTKVIYNETISNGTQTTLPHNVSDNVKLCNHSSFKVVLKCRDFPREHPDMQYAYLLAPEEGIVLVNLNETTRKPIWNHHRKHEERLSVTTKSNFDTWFNNGRDVVLEKTVTLKSKTSLPIKYGGPDFYPFDVEEQYDEKSHIYGSHNYFFTCEGHLNLYGHLDAISNGLPSGIKFEADGDLWVYLDDILVIDAGGMHPIRSNTVSLDILEAKPTNLHRLDIFYANRFPPNSTFSIEILNICIGCENGTVVDECGVCGGYGSTCNGDGNGDNDNGGSVRSNNGLRDDGKKEDIGDSLVTFPTISTYVQKTKCSVKITNKTTIDNTPKYNFKFEYTIENPLNQPTLLLISTNEYNGVLKTRGKCDNIWFNTNLDIKWEDQGHLWNPESKSILNSNYFIDLLTKNNTLFGTKTINFEIDISMEDLAKCLPDSTISYDQQWDSDSLKRLLTGSWFMSRISPVDLKNELLGTNLIYSTQCYFSILDDLLDSSKSHTFTYTSKARTNKVFAEPQTASTLPLPTTDVPIVITPTHQNIVLSTAMLKSHCTHPNLKKVFTPTSSQPPRISFSDLGLTLTLRVCTKVTLASWWSKILETGTRVKFLSNLDNATTFDDPWQSRIFVIRPILGGTDSCDMSKSGLNDNWNCCQDWILHGNDTILPPLVGKFVIEWKVDVFKRVDSSNTPVGLTTPDSSVTSQLDKIVEGRRFTIQSVLELDISDECGALKPIQCEKKIESSQLRDSICDFPFHPSHFISSSISYKDLIHYEEKENLLLFLSPERNHKWNTGNTIQSLAEGKIIYGTFYPFGLTVQGSKLGQCSEQYEAKIIQITSLVYPLPKRPNGGNKQYDSNLDQLQVEPCTSRLEYMEGNLALNDNRKSSSDLWNKDKCGIDFDWTVKKYECHPPKTMLTPETPHLDSNSPSPPSEESVELEWDPFTGKWSVKSSREVLHKSLTLSSVYPKDNPTPVEEVRQRLTEDSITVIKITWQLILKSAYAGSKDNNTSSQETLKRAKQDGGDPSWIHDHNFTHHDDASHFTTSCQSFHTWDWEQFGCVPNNFYWWFPTADYPYIWVAVGLGIFLLFIVFVCVLFSYNTPDDIELYRKTKIKEKASKISASEVSVKHYWWKPYWNSFSDWWYDKEGSSEIPNRNNSWNNSSYDITPNTYSKTRPDIQTPNYNVKQRFSVNSPPTQSQSFGYGHDVYDVNPSSTFGHYNYNDYDSSNFGSNSNKMW